MKSSLINSIIKSLTLKQYVLFKVRIERNKAVEETRDTRRAADRLEADRDRVR